MGKNTDKSHSKEKGNLQWWQLSLLGVACTIGTGFFLGSGLGIKIGGPSILFGFLLAAFGTYLVFEVLAKMTAEDPLEGSFCAYAKKAYGRWAGFSSGWVYWCSELLIMGSQMAALSLFTRFWFPNIPMWVFAAVYAVLGLLIIFIGTKAFEKMENIFAVTKVAAIVMFLILACLALFGVIGNGRAATGTLNSWNAWFPAGAKGLWSSLLYAFYAFGGIEIMGLMALRLKNPKDAPKAGKIMLTTLGIIYFLSLGLALYMVSWDKFDGKRSPFIVSLSSYGLPFVPHLFNAVLIIAGFSTMVASLFAVTSILVTLAQDCDAPPFFSKKTKGKKPLRAIGLTTCGLILSVVSALLLPESLYEYVTTAAGLMLLYNWMFILITSGKILKLKGFGQVKRVLGMLLLLTAISGTLLHHSSRVGFYVSLVFLALIIGITVIMTFMWKKQTKSQR
ncbi:amino acid permease [Paenibacillus gansuensis]|uniref:Amino acid permease n=1 Tax=Paenibacillus gansuensis TaxID=306542 RepID=A0ABW5PD09_9BACL